MGVRSDVAFVISKEDYETLEKIFKKEFPESKLLDCFELAETDRGEGRNLVRFCLPRNQVVHGRPGYCFFECLI